MANANLEKELESYYLQEAKFHFTVCLRACWRGTRCLVSKREGISRTKNFQSSFNCSNVHFSSRDLHARVARAYQQTGGVCCSRNSSLTKRVIFSSSSSVIILQWLPLLIQLFLIIGKICQFLIFLLIVYWEQKIGTRIQRFFFLNGPASNISLATQERSLRVMACRSYRCIVISPFNCNFPVIQIVKKNCQV